MIKERRVLIEVSDIKGIEMECSNPKCQSRHYIPIQQSDAMRDKCPTCGTNWFSKLGGPDWSAAQAFMDALKRLQAIEPAPPASIRLEISPDEVFE
jgi:hypothetical protein